MKIRAALVLASPPVDLALLTTTGWTTVSGAIARRIEAKGQRQDAPVLRRR